MNGLLAPNADREPVSAPPTPSIGRTALDRVRASGYLALRDVSCVVNNGVACLHGCLPSHYLLKGISAMLVLSRKQNEAIIINGDIRITVVRIHGHQVRIGIEAPDSVRIFREELCEPASASQDRPRPRETGVVSKRALTGSTKTVGYESAAGSVRR